MARFRIRTIEVGPQLPLPESDTPTYLGLNGIRSPIETAIQFRSHKAAERALMEEWYRLRNAGNKSIILSVVPSR